jgi:hypothetical protein
MASVIFSGRRVVNMSDEEMAAYLRENGYPEHVVRAGRKGLIERWSKFVAEVERGYKFGLEDYRNDLDLRGIISMLGMDQEVSEADRRFEALLGHRDKRIWESSGADPFWDFGYPANAGRQLMEDIKNEGLGS